MNKNIVLTNAYRQLLNDVLQEIMRHKIKAAQEVSITIMQLYYAIGGMIVRKQQEEGWGKAVVEQLASDLKTDKTLGKAESF